MFIGEYQHNLDEKGRLAVPAKFRQDLKNGGVVTRGLDNCLVVYPKKAWEKLAASLAALPINQAKARSFARFMLSGAMDVDFDQQGRITLPEYLRTFAGLDRKVVIAGLFDRLEIWDEDKWAAFKTGAEQNSAVIAESLEGLGIS